MNIQTFIYECDKTIPLILTIGIVITFFGIKGFYKKIIEARMLHQGNKDLESIKDRLHNIVAKRNGKLPDSKP